MLVSMRQLYHKHHSLLRTQSVLNFQQFDGAADAGSANFGALDVLQHFSPKRDVEYEEEEMQKLPALRRAAALLPQPNISARAFPTRHRNLPSPPRRDLRLPVSRCFGSWIDEAAAHSAETDVAAENETSLGWVPFRPGGDSPSSSSSWLPAEDAAFIDESILNNSAAPFCTCEVPRASHTVDGDDGLLCHGVQISVHPVAPRATRRPRTTTNPDSTLQQPPATQPTNFASRSLQAKADTFVGTSAFGLPQHDLQSWIANRAALPLHAQVLLPLQWIGGVREAKNDLEHETKVDVVLRLPWRVARQWKDDHVLRILVHRVARGLAACRRLHLRGVCSPTSHLAFRLLPQCIVYDDTKRHSSLPDVEAATGLSATGSWISNALFGDRVGGPATELDGEARLAVSPPPPPPPRFLLIAGPRFSPYHQYHGVFAPTGVTWVAWMLDVGMKAARRRMSVRVRDQAMITRGYFTSHEHCNDHRSALAHALINMTTGWGEHYRMRPQLSTSFEAASFSVGGEEFADANTTDARQGHDFVFLTHFAQTGDFIAGDRRFQRIARSWGAKIFARARSQFPSSMNETAQKSGQGESVLYDWRPRVEDPDFHRVRGMPVDDEHNILTMLERKGYGRFRNVSFGDSSSHSGTHSFEEQLDAIWSHSILVFAEGAFMTWMWVARPRTTFLMHFETTDLPVDRSEPYLYHMLRFAFYVHLCSSANVRLIVYVRQAGVSPSLGALAEALRRPFSPEMIIVRPGLRDGEPQRLEGDRTSVPSFHFPPSSVMHVASIGNGRWLLPTTHDGRHVERTNGTVDLVPGLFSRGLPVN